ncbi:MAG: thioredoxin [Candidatus Peribacteraceae bacterium]
MASPISDAEFATKILQSNKVVLLDFWAPWCGPCKAMLPVVDELTKKYEGKVEVYKMNVDENMDTPQKFNVMSIPTFVIFKGGEVKETFIGMKSAEEISSKLDALL